MRERTVVAAGGQRDGERRERERERANERERERWGSKGE
jgi:hypothetical protein